ncbi:MAG: peptidyl-prolyl cis-trans isomerase [Pseudoflavonifractor sp.]|nr:peptidyl-prolyl cis-trans isomerase [Alloprevotella sp.]MCM1116121.1 peptidyl-prolyl cis-trans isomerase [Pseudoflavonifractor sp.]
MHLRALLSLTLAASMGIGLYAKKQPVDPVVMTIAGKDVTLSEFEYLYHKNASQQVEPQTLDEYVDMFVNYKLKVAAAEAAGIDTTQAFRSEFEGYRDEIAAPYLTDTQMADSLMAAARSHLADNVDVSHIMFAPGTPKSRIDSVYNELKAGADFGALAAVYSVDQGTASREGRMGFITAARYPYSFEDMAYNTPVGEISAPFDTQFGTHIIKVNARQADPGQTHCRHILKMTRGLSETEAALKRQQIDSIHALLRQGADFIELAKAETDEPAGQRSGGDLPWFGPGMMVPEFETAAMALKPGELSDIVTTAFGYHIILCEERRATEPNEETDRQIKAIMQMDGRDKLPQARFLAKFRAERPALAGATDEEVLRAATDALPSLHRDYRNLLNEYRDGMLLYEMSNTEVWGRAAADKEGLKAFFEANRSRYTFDAPVYKGYVLIAKTDSLGQEAHQWLSASTDTIAPADRATALRAKYGTDVRIERVLSAKGENPIIDHLAFNGDKPADNPKWAYYATFDGRIIDSPEEPADVNGSVTADYQKALEEAWVASLREKYPVTIKQKALKKVKAN